MRLKFLLALLVVAAATLAGDRSPTTRVSAAETPLVVVSDTQTEWFNGSSWQPTAAAWVSPDWATIPGATWVWKSYKVSAEEAVNGSPVEMFRRRFDVPQDAVVTSAILEIMSDNGYVVSLNGQVIGSGGGFHSPASHNLAPVTGQNELTLGVYNAPQVAGNPWSNPAGFVFRVDVKYSLLPSAAPSSVVSPVFGALETVSGSTPCDGGRWCFDQHMLGLPNNFHGPGLGPGGANDTYAWDVNNYKPGFQPEDDANTPVFAVGPGVVAKTFGGQTNPYFAPNPNGNSWILIQHVTNGNVWWSGYLHMNDINPALAPGVQVDAFTELGKISDVGTSNSHLHFAVYEGSNVSDGLDSVDLTIFQRLDWFPLQSAATTGSSSIGVADPLSYNIGDVIRINPGADNEEDKTVIGFGSLILDSPLTNDHAASEPVVVTTSGDADTDDDGCDDQLEFGLDEAFGGLRDYQNPNDFYDVETISGPGQDGVVDLLFDILGVIQHYSPTGEAPYDAHYDRGPTTGPNAWNMTAPDGVIDLLNDILGVIRQFDHRCT